MEEYGHNKHVINSLDLSNQMTSTNVLHLPFCMQFNQMFSNQFIWVTLNFHSGQPLSEISI